jgi:glycosyltransferase involved in cell wall biosynthesis
MMGGDGARTSRSPHYPSRWGEGRGEGRQQTPEQASAPHPNPLSTSGGRESARSHHHVSVIIPCLDEEEAIGPCVAAVLAQGIGEVIVVDGQSSDRTADRAAAAGARVVVEPRRGYGRAMQSGLAAMSPASTIVLFIDGDGSDRPELVQSVLEPIEGGRADFVLGSRLRGEREPGSLAPAQIVAGRLAGLLIRILYGARFTDMSPFRAIRRDALDRLGMREETFGWNLEMQMRVAAARLRAVEVAVGQRRRAGGVSKVSGSWLTAMRAGWVLAATFCRLAIDLRRA